MVGHRHSKGNTVKKREGGGGAENQLVQKS
jgi:hypothetical protein